MADSLQQRSTEQIQQELLLAQRMLSAEDARGDLLQFAHFMMPDPDNYQDVTKSRYKAADHHRLLASALERVEAGTMMRLAISMPPQHGKTELASKLFIPWFIGRNPRKNIMFAAYSEDYARKVGSAVREYIRSPQYQQVFQGVDLHRDSTAKDAMQIKDGGQLNFIGRGGSGTGMPADLIVIDDPLKNAEEANSPATIEALHEWYSKVIYSRTRAVTRVVIIHTRWIEDDLIGRLCDPDHPWRREEAGKQEAKRWTYINIPAILQDDDVTRALGREPGEALWPEEFTLEHLRSAQQLNPQAFGALYQGKPTPDDGEYFKAEWLLEYERDDLPAEEDLRFYGASDHATSTKQVNDPNILGVVGIDKNDTIWVMPDLVWERMETDRVVEEMIELMKRYKPALWWMENELISKSFGPFLRRRMHESRTYCVVDPVRPSADKRTRARAIQGRMAMQKVRFPRFAPWWPDARAELLKFDKATHDDFVDFMAWIGLGLTKEIGASENRIANDNPPKTGTIQWIKARARGDERRKARDKAIAGW